MLVPILLLLFCRLPKAFGDTPPAIAPNLFSTPAAAALELQPNGKLPSLLRARPAAADLSLIDRLPTDGSGSLRFNLFDDAAFTARFSHLDTVSTPSRAWWGELDGDPFGTFTLIRSDSGMLGVIRAANKGTFEIRADKDGATLIREIDTSVFTCAGAESKASFAPAPDRISLSSESSLQPATMTLQSAPPLPPSPPVIYGCDDGSVIDVMIVYTPQARIAAGGTTTMNNNAAFAVADMNAALSRSLVNTSVRLVFSYETNYTETGNNQVDAQRLIDPADGYLDDVPPLRDFYGADCISLWCDTYGGIGFGYFPDASLQGVGYSGLTFCDWRGYNGLLIAHEIGHNLWCAHQWGNGDTPPQLNYAHGFVEPGNAWRDIMASAAIPAIPYYANPNVNWPGPNPPHPGPTGVPINQPNPADLATAIGQTRTIVANFRATSTPGLPAILYVKASAPAGGNGQSWGTAFRDLQDALCKAAGSRGAVQQIWVAAGTYKPDRGSSDRTMSFNLQNNLAIYGGFAGTETTLAQRNINANVTTLSGDIGTAGNNSDNSYHVVRGYNLGTGARLDGFTITGANANSPDFPDNHGGGIRLETANPVIANCTFTGNSAGRHGGAALCYINANAMFTGCTFTSNSVPEVGGAMHTYFSNVTLTNCTFNTNNSGYGGAMFVESSTALICTGCTFTGNSAQFGGAINSRTSGLTLTNCTFTSNTATSNGGALENDLSAIVTATNCQFNTNTAGYGGAVFNYVGSNGTFSQCTFTSNSAGVAGGVLNHDSSPTITGCTFSQNHATSDVSGGIWNENNSVPIIRNCTFSQNTAANGGAAIGNSTSAAIVRNCNFIANTATHAGAVWNITSSNAFYANCKFLGNGTTNGAAGAMQTEDSSPTLVNCLFSGNHCNSDGGALAVYNNSGGAIINCTFSRNTAGFLGAISMGSPALTIANSILWGNTGGGSVEEAQISNWNGGTLTINRCIVQGWTGSLGGTANNGSNPLFADDDGADNTVGTADDNLHCGSTSPAIDTGDNAALPPDAADLNANANVAETTPLDLDDHLRVLNSTVDRGAYEFIPTIPCDFDHDGDVDIDDFNHFKTCATRSGIAQTNGACADAKLDADTDVDMNDFAIFQRCYSGAGKPGRTNCAN